MRNFLKKIKSFFAANELDRRLYRASLRKKKTFLIGWNRGLGDIALGMYALVYRIRQEIPDAKITFVTRKDLHEGFHLLDGVDVIPVNELKRGDKICLKQSLAKLNKSHKDYDVLIDAPNPTKWLSWQIGGLVPKLSWRMEWDELWRRFPLQEEQYVGVHVHSETTYGYEKNWPFSYWEEFFRKITTEKNLKVILFGFEKKPVFDIPGVIDLRGETTLFEMLSIIKNRCSILVVPDSGVLSLTYYIDVSFPLKVISLWADPRQGVLKQNVPSPNGGLQHNPILAKDEDIRNISVEEVLRNLT